MWPISCGVPIVRNISFLDCKPENVINTLYGTIIPEFLKPCNDFSRVLNYLLLKGKYCMWTYFRHHDKITIEQLKKDLKQINENRQQLGLTESKVKVSAKKKNEYLTIVSRAFVEDLSIVIEKTVPQFSLLQQKKFLYCIQAFVLNEIPKENDIAVINKVSKKKLLNEIKNSIRLAYLSIDPIVDVNGNTITFPSEPQVPLLDNIEHEQESNEVELIKVAEPSFETTWQNFLALNSNFLSDYSLEPLYSWLFETDMIKLRGKIFSSAYGDLQPCLHYCERPSHNLSLESLRDWLRNCAMKKISNLLEAVSTIILKQLLAGLESIEKCILLLISDNKDTIIEMIVKKWSTEFLGVPKNLNLWKKPIQDGSIYYKTDIIKAAQDNLRKLEDINSREDLDFLFPQFKLLFTYPSSFFLALQKDFMVYKFIELPLNEMQRIIKNEKYTKSQLSRFIYLLQSVSNISILQPSDKERMKDSILQAYVEAICQFLSKLPDKQKSDVFKYFCEIDIENRGYNFILQNKEEFYDYTKLFVESLALYFQKNNEVQIFHLEKMDSFSKQMLKWGFESNFKYILLQYQNSKNKKKKHIRNTNEVVQEKSAKRQKTNKLEIFEVSSDEESNEDVQIISNASEILEESLQYKEHFATLNNLIATKLEALNLQRIKIADQDSGLFKAIFHTLSKAIIDSSANERNYIQILKEKLIEFCNRIECESTSEIAKKVKNFLQEREIEFKNVKECLGKQTYCGSLHDLILVSTLFNIHIRIIMPTSNMIHFATLKMHQYTVTVIYTGFGTFDATK